MADETRNPKTNLNNPANTRRDVRDISLEKNQDATGNQQIFDDAATNNEGRQRSVGSVGNTAGMSAGNTGASINPIGSPSDVAHDDYAGMPTAKPGAGMASANANNPSGTGNQDANDADAGRDENRDPLSGAPGAHPVGVGLGAAAGGAASGAATGAVIGTVAGPVGTAVGAAIGTAVGAIAGGYAGKGIAEAVNPTAEHDYWRNNYRDRPYVNEGDTYDEYSDAYEYGWTAHKEYGHREWADAESDIRSGWEKSKGGARMTWERAKDAIRDSWNRITSNRSGRSSSAREGQRY